MDSNKIYRICYSHLPFLLEPLDPRQLNDNNFVSNTRLRFKGSLSLITSLISDVFLGTKEKTFNYTMDLRGSTGLKFICLDSLNRNQSDVFLAPVPLSLPPESNLDLVAVTGESKIKFLTGYSTENNVKNGDLLDSMQDFSFIMH